MSKKLRDKKSKIFEEEKDSTLKKFLPVAIVVVGVIAAYFVFFSSPTVPTTGSITATDLSEVQEVAESVKTKIRATDYAGQTVEMSNVDVEVKDGEIYIPLNELINKKLVSFEYAGKKKVPLMAYITPSGKILTATRMCEPCKSTAFFIRDNKMVCSRCFTEWDIESLRGLYGGCMAYPPESIQNSIEGDFVVISAEDVEAWTPRV